MHFHLPKPLHGWREFLGEVGIIVLGVLVALGFEQLVQSAHDHWIAQEAHASIRAEVRENLWWIDRRDDYEPCISSMLSELEGVLTLARNGQPTPQLTDVGLPIHAKITSLRWDANAEAGRASLFSGNEQRNLGNMYFTTEEFRASQEEEENVWAKLGFIDGLDHFTPLDIHDLSVLLAEARYRDFRAQLDVTRAREWANKLGLTPSNPESVENITPSEKVQCPALTRVAATR